MTHPAHPAAVSPARVQERAGVLAKSVGKAVPGTGPSLLHSCSYLAGHRRRLICSRALSICRMVGGPRWAPR
eukprot:351219-Chlamydomonas_euryale.AAC.12